MVALANRSSTAQGSNCRGCCRRGKQRWPYPPGQSLEQVETASSIDCLERLDAQVKKVHDCLQPGSLLLVVTGQGDTTHQRHKEVRKSCIILQKSTYQFSFRMLASLEMCDMSCPYFSIVRIEIVQMSLVYVMSVVSIRRWLAAGSCQGSSVCKAACLSYKHQGPIAAWC